MLIITEIVNTYAATDPVDCTTPQAKHILKKLQILWTFTIFAFLPIHIGGI